jgi:cob(I)alamin adenosyltransferase
MNTQEVGGYAPGAREHITGEEDSPADIADQEAAGVAPEPVEGRPTRPTAHASTSRDNAAGSAQGNGSNQPRAVSPKAQYNALKRKVQELGEQHGKGKTSMIALAEAVTESAQDGAITVEQVPEIYDQFKAGVTKKSNYEDAGEVSDEAAMGMAPAKSIEQQLSKLRQFVILGGKYESDALDLIRKARNMHIELLRSANGDAEVKKGIKPGSTYTVMVDVARAQLKKNKDALDAAKLAKTPHTLAPVLTTDELRAFMTQEVREPVDKTGEDYLLDTLIKARATFKGSDKRNAITCEELTNAIEWLRAAMGKVAPDMLAAYDAEEAAAHQAREDAKRAKQEAEEEKARKAAEPKLSKAERQAALATPAQQGAAQPAA